jgi:uncharacterized protein (DUF433 family)
MYNSFMPKALNNYISYDPQIFNGSATIVGTRIPIERVVNLVRQGYSTKELKEEFPHLESQKIQKLISYLMEAGLDAHKTFSKVQTASR